MAVVPVVSGATVESSDIVDMHGTVRTILNGFNDTNIQRGSLSSKHLSGLVDDDGLTEVTSAVTISYQSTNPESDVGIAATVATNWDSIASVAGTTFEPGKTLIFAYWHLQDWTVDEGQAAYDNRHQLWVALKVFIGATAWADVSSVNGYLDARMIRQSEDLGQVSDGLNNADQYAKAQNWPCSLVAIYDAPTSTQITKFELFGALCAGGGSSMGSVGDVTCDIDRVTLFFVHLKDES